MTKKDFIAKVAKNCGFTQGNTDAVYTAMIEELTKAMEIGEDVTFLGFGRFEPKVVPAHTGRNPATGETIDIPEKMKVTFKTSPTLKKAINS